MHMQAQENPEQPEAPKHVILFSYNPQLKAMVRYDALVIGTRDFEENDRPVLNLVHFRHDDIASHHCLQGVDWADTLERTLDVPHQSDVENQSFYWLEDDAAILEQKLEKSRHALREYDLLVDVLTKQLAATTEGKDAALQQLADELAELRKIPAEEPAEPASGPQLVSEPAPSTE